MDLEKLLRTGREELSEKSKNGLVVLVVFLWGVIGELREKIEQLEGKIAEQEAEES